MNEINKEKISAILKTADIHKERLEQSLKKLEKFFRLNIEKVKDIKEEQMLWLELLVHRFSKLHDLIGSKLVDLFLIQTEEVIQIESITMRDIK